MNGLVFHIFSRLHHPFRKGRMGVNHAGELRHCSFKLHRESRFMDEIGRVGADNVDAENLPARRVGNYLAKAGGLPSGLRLSQRRVPKSTDFQVTVRRTTFRFMSLARLVPR